MYIVLGLCLCFVNFLCILFCIMEKDGKIKLVVLKDIKMFLVIV